MSDAAYKEWRMNTHNAAQAAAAAERRKIREIARIDVAIAGLRAKRAAIEACYEVAMSFVDNDGESQDNLR